ncbi:hypothetical protein Plhal304r1_c023g0079381 [Plasmopara halstedii]
MMLQESFLGGESITNSKKALAQAQKLLQLATVRPSALALREYRETLEECLQPEGNVALRIVGFQLAQLAPGCITHEVWKFILEAVVTELGSTDNKSTLAAAIPVFQKIPMPLVLGFLLSSEKEPMNKLRSILTHNDRDICSRAIETLSHLMSDVAVNVAEDGLFVFPFESHEARICCQQDLETIVNDTWKLIFQTLFDESPCKSALSAAGAAFSALMNLFARSSTIAPFFIYVNESIRVQAPLNDVVSMIYRQASLRIRAVITVARSLPVKQQPDAMLWIAMLLYTMMERSGARCPSVSVPYVEIDTETLKAEDADDDDEPHASTEYVRVDDIVIEFLESWVFPTISRQASLAQATNMCRAIFILLTHPLQTFSRMRWAAQLANHLIAQCYFADKSSGDNSKESSKKQKVELGVMLVINSAWLSGVNCLDLFVCTVEALYLLDQEQDQRDLIQTLMNTITDHVLSNQNYQLLQSLCSMAIFRQSKGFSRLSPQTNGSEVFQALFQALYKTPKSPSRAAEHQISQLIALKMFRGLLLVHLNDAFIASPKAHQRSSEIAENIEYYIGLLASHFQGIIDRPELALRESLEFFQKEVFPTMEKIASCGGRYQILWIAVQLHQNYASHVPFDALVRKLTCETGRLFSAMCDDDETEGATFDSGLLGGDEGPTGQKHADDVKKVEALMVIGDCIMLLAQMYPQTRSQFHQMCENMGAALLVSKSPSVLISQQYRILEDVMSFLSNCSTVDTATRPAFKVSKELFDPRGTFLPRRDLCCSNVSVNEEYRELVTVTGCADPVSVQVSHHQLHLDEEEVVTLVVTCCNLTTWALSDLELLFRPIGGVRVVQCVTSPCNLKLRLLCAGETISVSGGCTVLPPFGVIKAQKQFRVCKFTQATFLIQVVLFQEPNQDGGATGDVGTTENSPTPLHLAFSNPYVLHFDTLLRQPQSQFATASFFRHCWQSADSSAVWQVDALEAKGEKIGIYQHALHVMNSKLAAVSELTFELPMQFNIAMLTQTRWGSYISASLSMSLDSDLSWSGNLELRSTLDIICEFQKWPNDSIHLFCGNQVNLKNTLATTCESVQPSNLFHDAVSNSRPLIEPSSESKSTESNSLSALETFANENPATVEIEPTATSVIPSFSSDWQFTTSFDKDMNIPLDQVITSSHSNHLLEQMRSPETTDNSV